MVTYYLKHLNERLTPTKSSHVLAALVDPQNCVHLANIHNFI
jgi:hypothetical protein